MEELFHLANLNRQSFCRTWKGKHRSKQFSLPEQQCWKSIRMDKNDKCQIPNGKTKNILRQRNMPLSSNGQLLSPITCYHQIRKFRTGLQNVRYIFFVLLNFVRRHLQEPLLLKGFCFAVDEVELLLAVGTIGEFEFNDFVDEFWGEGSS